MPIQQHPVPQQISSYEFRLIGDMTLKQFGWLVGGALTGLFFWSLPIFPFFKGLLAAGAVFFGFASAFLPIEERPLPNWIFAFFKSVFSPTLYTWKKTPETPEIFRYQIKSFPQEKNHHLPPNRNSLSQYLHRLETKTFPKEENEEKKVLENILSLFSQVSSLKINHVFEKRQPSYSSISTPTKKEQPPSFQSIKKPTLEKPKEEKSSPKFVDLKEKDLEEVAPGGIGENFYSYYGYPGKPPIETVISYYHKLSQLPKKPPISPKTNKELPIPTPPSYPNIIAGMVLDQNDELIEGALIEIKDKNGMPVRALKTNKLGQFRIVTPLPDGIYEIQIEKEGYEFDIIKIELKGEIVPPLEIRGKKVN
ncbi:MAG: carboxypeptidase regulatory-like domain-containing protein [Microgenomates group bacterium]